MDIFRRKITYMEMGCSFSSVMEVRVGEMKIMFIHRQ